MESVPNEPSGPILTGRSADPEAARKFKAARLSRDHYAAIGQVAARWSELESAIEIFLGSAARVNDDIATCFTAQMIGIRPRLDAYIALVKYRGAHKRWDASLEKFAQRAVALAERRNRVIHDMWILDEPERPLRLEGTARRKLRIDPVPVSTRELLALVYDIRQFTTEFVYGLANPISRELPPLRDRPQQ